MNQIITYNLIGAKLKYTLLLFIGYSPKMNKKVIYAYNTYLIQRLF